jgi:hypothetical protein
MLNKIFMLVILTSVIFGHSCYTGSSYGASMRIHRSLRIDSLHIFLKRPPVDPFLRSSRLISKSDFRRLSSVDVRELMLKHKLYASDFLYIEGNNKRLATLNSLKIQETSNGYFLFRWYFIRR